MRSNSFYVSMIYLLPTQISCALFCSGYMQYCIAFPFSFSARMGIKMKLGCLFFFLKMHKSFARRYISKRKDFYNYDLPTRPWEL